MVRGLTASRHPGRNTVRIMGPCHALTDPRSTTLSVHICIRVQGTCPAGDRGGWRRNSIFRFELWKRRELATGAGPPARVSPRDTRRMRPWTWSCRARARPYSGAVPIAPRTGRGLPPGPNSAGGDLVPRGDRSSGAGYRGDRRPDETAAGRDGGTGTRARSAREWLRGVDRRATHQPLSRG